MLAFLIGAVGAVGIFLIFHSFSVAEAQRTKWIIVSPIGGANVPSRSRGESKPSLSERISQRLLAAGIVVPLSTVATGVVGGAIVTMLLVGVLTNSFLVGVVVGGILTALVVNFFLTSREERRRELVEVQMSKVIPLVTSLVMSGATITEALRQVSSRVGSPVGTECAWVTSQVDSFKVPLQKAMERAGRRLNNGEWNLLTSVVSLHAGRGGNLAVELNHLAADARRRVRLRRELSRELASIRMDYRAYKK
jgi:Flp pilus assembly protein TadB